MNIQFVSRGGLTLLAVTALLLQAACFNTFHDNEDDNPENSSSVAQQVLVIVNINETDETTGETSRCNNTLENPATIDGTVATTVPAGSICYFKFTASRGGLNPVFTLNSSSGNADLYVDFKNDSTGGTAGSTDCDTTTSGGGWDRCSRNHESGSDQINSNESGILTMSNGDFRLLAVFGHGDQDATFTLEVTD